MKKDPSMPFYVNDWLSSTKIACMTLEEQGAYLRLLCYCWASQEASLPDDDQQLAALSGMGEGWLKGGCHLVRDCFQPHPHQTGKLTNSRLLELWQERQEWREKSRLGGKKSAASRAKKRASDDLKGGSTTVATKRQPNGNSSSSSSSSSSVLKPLTPFPFKRGKIQIPESADSVEFRTALVAWLEHKQSSGHGYKNAKSLQTAVDKWLRDMGPDAFPAAVEHSIASNYQGLFQEHAKGTNGRPQLFNRNQQREAANAAALDAAFGTDEELQGRSQDPLLIEARD